MLDISLEDKKKMQNYIGAYSDCAPDKVNIEQILKNWRSCKSDYLYRLLGEQLMVTAPIEFSQPLELDLDSILKLDTIKNVLDKIYYPLTYTNPEALYILEIMGDIFDKVNFIQQSAFKEKVQIRGIYFHKGEKWYKSARKFITKVCTELNETVKSAILEDIEFLQLRYSMLVQSLKKDNFEVTLSIHPLDYITMSDNAIGWHTCMSWSTEGDYHAGTVEMMNSTCVIVAYIAQKDNKLFNGWNSKRWRQLFIVTPSCIIASCPYPFSAPHYTHSIFNVLRELAEKNLGWHFNNKLREIGDVEHDWLCEHTEDDGAFMYIDYLEKSDTCAIAFRAQNEMPEQPVIPYSGAAMCMVCGEEWIEEGESHLCPHCEGGDKGYCDHCESRAHLTQTDDGYALCIDCLEEYSWTCEECGRTFYSQGDESYSNILVKGTGDDECSYWETVCDDCYCNLEQEGRILKDE